MNPGDARKLIGGYAAGNLTDEERRRLLEAALEDQETFNALAAEEPLRELLADPVSRQRLARSVEPVPPIPWFRRPLVWTLTGSTAALVFVAGFLIEIEFRQPVAMLKLEPPAAARLSRDELQMAPPPASPRPSKQTRERRASNAPAAAPSPAISMPAEPEVPALAAQALPESPAVRAKTEAAPGAVRRARSFDVAGGASPRTTGANSLAMLPATETATPLLRYNVLRRTPEEEWTPIPETALRDGDAVRVVILCGGAGELQVSARDAEGVWRPLLPAGFRVQPGTRSLVPPEGAFTLSGELRLTATLTPGAGQPTTLEIKLHSY